MIFVLQWVFSDFAAEASAQTVEHLLPRDNDPKQYEYGNISCSDDHNCTTPALAWDFDDKVYRDFFERTTDGGRTWIQQRAPFSGRYAINVGKSLRGVYSVDSMTVFAYGDSGMMARTTDAGHNWEDISIAEYRPIVGMSFTDQFNGLAIGGGGLVMLTSDRGDTWDTIPDFPFVLFRSVRMFSPDTMAIHQHSAGIYYTTDRWQTRDSLPSVVDPWEDSTSIRLISGIRWIDKQRLIATGKIHYPRPPEEHPPYVEHPYIMTSNDGGRSWTERYKEASYLYGIGSVISLLQSGYGLAGGRGRGFLRTTDHGVTWSDDTIATDIDFFGSRDVAMLNDHTALANLTLTSTGTIARITYSPASVDGFIEKVRYGTRIHPNPSTGVVSINKWYDSERGITIVDMLGRPVYSGMLEPGPGSTTLDLSALPAGLYSLVVNFGDRALPAGRFLMLK